MTFQVLELHQQGHRIQNQPLIQWLQSSSLIYLGGRGIGAWHNIQIHKTCAGNCIQKNPSSDINCIKCQAVHFCFDTQLLIGRSSSWFFNRTIASVVSCSAKAAWDSLATSLTNQSLQLGGEHFDVSGRLTWYMAAKIRVTASSTRSGCFEVLDGLWKTSGPSPGISWSKPSTKEAWCTAHQSDWTKPWKPSSPFSTSVKMWWLEQLYSPSTLL